MAQSDLTLGYTAVNSTDRSTAAAETHQASRSDILLRPPVFRLSPQTQYTIRKPGFFSPGVLLSTNFKNSGKPDPYRTLRLFTEEPRPCKSCERIFLPASRPPAHVREVIKIPPRTYELYARLSRTNYCERVTSWTLWPGKEAALSPTVTYTSGES